MTSSNSSTIKNYKHKKIKQSGHHVQRSAYKLRVKRNINLHKTLHDVATALVRAPPVSLCLPLSLVYAEQNVSGRLGQDMTRLNTASRHRHEQEAQLGGISN